MGVPDFQTLMLPVLRASAEGEVRISDVVEKLADELKLTAEERTHLLPSGKQSRFANRVNWAKSYLGKAGLIHLTRRAHFVISDDGRRVLENPPDRITIKYLEQFEAFREFREGNGASGPTQAASTPSDDEGDILTPDEVMRQAHKEIEEALAVTLLQRLRAGTPAFFEKVVVNLLIAMGYGGSDAEISTALVGKSGDGGVDGVIDQDPLGLDRIYVQAKRYADGNSVGSGAIRDFFGSLDDFKASKGLFVTTSTFTASAKDTANRLSKRIVLIDGKLLAKLMIRHNVGCRTVETLEMKKEDDDFFE
jgi:restriction system protein